MQGTRAVDDFVQALRNTDPTFYRYWTNHLENTDIYPLLSDIVNKFRKQQQKEAALNPQHGAFTASFRGERTSSPRKYTDCVCGQEHRSSDCPYLMESQRTAGWTPNPETERRVTERLENPRLREAVERARNFVQYRSRSRNASQHRAAPDTDESPAGIPNVFTTEIVSGETEVYPLRESFILDSGAGVHVCNNPQRLRNRRPVANKFLMTGSHREAIDGFGEVDIVVQALDRQQRTVTLKDVALVPTFRTSIVSYKRFENIGGSWDTRAKALMYGSKTFCTILDKHGQFVVEYTPLDAPPTETTDLPTGSATDSDADLPTDSATDTDLTDPALTDMDSATDSDTDLPTDSATDSDTDSETDSTDTDSTDSASTDLTDLTDSAADLPYADLTDSASMYTESATHTTATYTDTALTHTDLTDLTDSTDSTDLTDYGIGTRIFAPPRTWILAALSNWGGVLTWGVGETSPRSLPEPRSREKKRIFPVY